MGEKTKKKIQRLKENIDWWNTYWISIISIPIIISLAGLFILSIFLKHIITLSIMNEWVSFILGIVATILSVISILLSFYNLEKSEESERSSERVFYRMVLLQKSIEKMIKETYNDTKEIKERMYSMSNPIHTETKLFNESDFGDIDWDDINLSEINSDDIWDEEEPEIGVKEGFS